MRSRSLRELLVLAFGAVADGVWCGALAAALVGASGPRLMLFAVVTIFAAAVLALRLGRERQPSRRDRVLVVGLALGAAVVLVVAGQAWDTPNPLAWVVADVAYAALLVLVGVGLGGVSLTPELAARRGIRAFALLCLVLAAAAIGGSPPSWATEALAITLVAGGLFVAAARYETLTALTPAEERAPAWAWLLAVLGVTLLIVSTGFLLTEALRVDFVSQVLSAVGTVLGYLLAVVAYAIGFAGAALIRAIAWLVGLLHLHAFQPPELPERPGGPDIIPSPAPQPAGARRVSRLFTIVTLAALAVGASLALVALALRRFRRGLPEEVEEERETVLTFRAAAAAGAGRLAGRLRRLVTRTPPPRTPAELVRRRYAELERRLRRAGHARPPGTTVRGFLRAVSAGADAPPDVAGPLAGLYELARYSTETVDAAAAGAFERLALDLAAAVTST